MTRTLLPDGILVLVTDEQNIALSRRGQGLPLFLTRDAAIALRDALLTEFPLTERK